MKISQMVIIRVYACHIMWRTVASMQFAFHWSSPCYRPSVFSLANVWSFHATISNPMQIKCGCCFGCHERFYCAPHWWCTENNKLILSVLEIIICVKILAHLGHHSTVDPIKETPTVFLRVLFDNLGNDFVSHLKCRRFLNFPALSYCLSSWKGLIHGEIYKI